MIKPLNSVGIMWVYYKNVLLLKIEGIKAYIGRLDKLILKCYVQKLVHLLTSAVTNGNFFGIVRRSDSPFKSHSSKGPSLSTTTKYCLKKGYN